MGRCETTSTKISLQALEARMSMKGNALHGPFLI